ncbi:tpr repeat containing protein [Anaeramoeba flamelloides]|uniref:Tpr repeat containing protein n=1 Tax=Anaeramoeba flamelloides TaxID=1746091 RepID=A0AAV7ZXZ9_9EUKA|nr:tpr repeat containing protein [Anaeramoeba flamelloides]
MENQSQILKQKGNEKFKAGDYASAIDFYTQAIKITPTNHLLYSNRSLCYGKMGQTEKSLKDAERCIQLEPNFGKGHYRLGASLLLLQRYEEALEAFQISLKLDPNNSLFIQKIRLCRTHLQSNLQNSTDEKFQKLFTNKPNEVFVLNQDKTVKFSSGFGGSKGFLICGNNEYSSGKIILKFKIDTFPKSREFGGWNWLQFGVIKSERRKELANNPYCTWEKSFSFDLNKYYNGSMKPTTKTFERKKEQKYGQKIDEGEIVTFFIDQDQHIISFGKDESNFGLAFENLPEKISFFIVSAAGNQITII